MQHDTTATGTATGKVAPNASKRVRILVIDDEISAAEGVQDILELEGHIVGIAHDQQSALQAAQMMAPDMALVDLRLKEEWGLDVIAALHKQYPNLLCIVQTGNSDSSAVISALRQGVYDYLVKPFEPDQLLKVTERAAEKLSLENERYQMLQELSKAKEQAELASKSKTEFLTRMGGELGQHFSTLVQLASTMENEQFGPIGNEQYSTCARGISSGCTRMLRNMQKIGELGRLEAGSKQVDISDFILTEIFDKALADHQADISAKQLVVEVSVENDIPTIQSDPIHFIAILDHLISNATKFSQPGGRISLSARMDEKSDLWLQVNDHGCGMDNNQISIAMAPFGRVGDENTAGFDPFCAGLGLPLAARLTHLLGGKLGLKSASGTGTSARVFFPKDKVFEFAKMRSSVL